MRLNKVAIALGLTSVVIMGCDGGSSGSSSSPSVTPSTTYLVKAIDGYLRNAKVWLDINRDFLHDEGTEPSAVTGEGGVAELDVSDIENYQDYPIVVHAIAGETIDEDTIDDANPVGQVMPGSMVLSAPAGESNITPLSSFVHILMNKDPNALNDPQQREALKQQAVEEAANQLGLTADTLLDDYLDEGSRDPKATYAAQSIVKSEQVLPKTPQDMAALAQDVQSAGENAEKSVTQLMIAEAINEKIKQEVESKTDEELATAPPPVAPPSDDAPPVDDDADGVPNDLDEFPNNADEWIDSDGDGMGNNQDAFDFDPTEQYDTDLDGIGNQADPDDDNDGFNDDIDEHALDATQAGDHDEDGFDSVIDAFPYDETLAGDHDSDGYDSVIDEFWNDNTKAGDHDDDDIDSIDDAYPNDGAKSVLDQVTQSSGFIPVLNVNHRELIKLNVEVEQTIETFNDNTITTTSTTRYISEGGVEYGYKQSVDTQAGNDFTRIEDFHFDFNLDGIAQFEGRTLDIGTRSANGESFWRYVDESDASSEGGVNGSGRVFDDLDFSNREHPLLTDIDTVQWFEVSYSQNGEALNYTTSMTQYNVEGFVLADIGTHIANYASINESVIVDLLETAMQDSQDWDADGSINTILAFVGNDDGSYVHGYGKPIWANPQDGIHEEYADFNYTSGNWDNLTSYWYEYTREVSTDGTVTERGYRSVLDEDNNSKLTDDEHIEGYLFHQWDKVTRYVSDTERTEFVTWTHLALEGYDFTAQQDNPGQSYTIYSHQVDGIWTTLSFDEWGSTNVENLADKVENARSGGTSMYSIDASVVPGLHRYAASLPNASFQYHTDGTPRTWYAVTQDPRLTDGTPTVVTITLSDNGVLPDSYVVSNGPDLILVAPLDGNNIDPRFDAYYRQRIDMWGLDMDPDHFNWTTNIGQLFVNQDDAQARLTEIINPAYRVCSHQNTGIRTEPADNYWDFSAAANNCGYIGIDASYLDGLTLYYQEDAENYFSYQFNANGSGTYYESNGEYSDGISWYLTDTGIIAVNNGGDQEHFAYIADQDGRYSVVGFFEWQENGSAYSEIIGMEMTSYLPTGYAVCTQGDTEWDEANSRPASSPVYSDLYQTVSDCGGAMPLSAYMLDGLVWYDYNVDKDRLKEWHFSANGTVLKVKNGVESGPYTWIIDENGYLKILYDQNNADDFIVLALISSDGYRYALKALDSYPEEVDGQTEIWSEIVTEEFVTVNPVDKVSVITALAEQVNWYSPWSEWDEGEQKDHLYFDHLDITQADLLSWTETSVVEVNKTLSAIDISDDFDLMLTAEGWKKVTGFEFDLTNDNIVASSPVASSLTYSVIYAAVHDKEGGNISNEAPGDWNHYLGNSDVYPSGAEVVAVTLRNDADSYYLLDWRPYHMLSEAGVDNDSDVINSIDELFVTSSAGNDSQGDLLDSASIGHEVSVELVRPLNTDTSGEANFFTVDWDNNLASLVATGTWEIRELNGETLVLFEIPQTVIDSYGNVIESNGMFYSVYRSATGGDDLVYVGQYFAARSELEEIYMFNGSAKDAIVSAADIQ